MNLRSSGLELQVLLHQFLEAGAVHEVGQAHQHPDLAPTREPGAFTMGVDINDFKGFLEALADPGVAAPPGWAMPDGVSAEDAVFTSFSPGCFNRMTMFS